MNFWLGSCPYCLPTTTSNFCKRIDTKVPNLFTVVRQHKGPRLVCTTTPEPFPAHMVLAAVRKTIPVRAGNGNGLVHQADRVVPGFCLQFILCQVGSGWLEDNTQQQPGLCTDCTVGNFNKVKGNQTPSLAMLLAFFPSVKV